MYMYKVDVTTDNKSNVVTLINYLFDFLKKWTAMNPSLTSLRINASKTDRQWVIMANQQIIKKINDCLVPSKANMVLVNKA